MVIEKNIPLPTEAKESASRFPFDDMEIGDSFIASRDPLAFIEIVEEMEKRNEAGDNVAIAVKHLQASTQIVYQNRTLRLSHDILEGHRFALHPIAA